jgi:hypothetical protein
MGSGLHTVLLLFLQPALLTLATLNLPGTCWASLYQKSTKISRKLHGSRVALHGGDTYPKTQEEQGGKTMSEVKRINQIFDVQEQTPLSPCLAFVVQFRSGSKGTADACTGRVEHMTSGQAPTAPRTLNSGPFSCES